jgi:hypothetical protein
MQEDGILAPIFSVSSGLRAYFQPSAQEILVWLFWPEGIALLTYKSAHEIETENNPDIYVEAI